MKKGPIYFEAILKQSSKGAIKIDAEAEAEITFTVSAIELANMLPVVNWGTEILKVGIMLSDKVDNADEDPFKW